MLIYCRNEIKNALDQLRPTFGQKVSIDNVIFSKSEKTKKMTTVVFWSDGTKTTARNCSLDEPNKEAGLAVCICKKVLGNNFRKLFNYFCYNEKFEFDADKAKESKENKKASKKKDEPKEEILEEKKASKDKNEVKNQPPLEAVKKEAKTKETKDSKKASEKNTEKAKN